MTQPKNPSLRELLALPVSVALGAHQVQLTPMGWHQAAAAIEPLLPALNVLPVALQGYGGLPAEEKFGAWLGVVVSHRDELAQFASLASGFDIAEVRLLQPAQFIELLIALFELNADFFVRGLPAMIERMAGRLPALKAKLEAALEPTACTTSSSA